MGFSALIEITDLLGGVHQLHRLTLDRNNLQHFLEQSRALASRIKAWNKSLPEAYTTLPEEDTKRVLVQLLYNAAQIKLHSLVSSPTRRDSSSGPRLTRVGLVNLARISPLSISHAQFHRRRGSARMCSHDRPAQQGRADPEPLLVVVLLDRWTHPRDPSVQES